MENIEIGTWLLQQSPVIVVMGVVIWWLSKRLVKAEEEKDTLSKDVVKLTTIWENKYEDNNGKEDQIIQLLTEIKTIVSNR